jgi:hypothetical protein
MLAANSGIKIDSSDIMNEFDVQKMNSDHKTLLHIIC